MRNDASLLLLDQHAVDALLTPELTLAAVEAAFALHSAQRGRVFPVVREALPGGGIFGIKAGDVPDEHVLGFKAAGFWPANRTRGGEPHQATIVLIDPATGRPLCVIDGNAITTARTGAAGGLGLRALARPDSARLAVFGTGVQARVQVDYALRMLPALRTVRYRARRGAADAAFEAHFADRCDIAPAADADAMVANSDVVITATPGGGPLFSAHAVQPGTHVTAVGADTRGKRELPDKLLQRALLVVDDLAQARQIGEAQWSPTQHADELGQVLGGHVDIGRQADDITVLDLTGLALQDLTVARAIRERALATGRGLSIDWPWTPTQDALPT